MRPESRNRSARPPKTLAKTILITVVPKNLWLLLFERRGGFRGVLTEEPGLEHLDLYARSQLDLGVPIAELHELANQTTLGQHTVPLLQRGQHLRLLLLLRAAREEHQQNQRHHHDEQRQHTDGTDIGRRTTAMR